MAESLGRTATSRRCSRFVPLIFICVASGRVALVMPMAALTRGQFEKFRTGRFTSSNIAWDEAWTTDVKAGEGAIFPVPSCVVLGRKRAISKAMPRKVREYTGWLPLRDAEEQVADARLTVNENAAAPETGEFEGGSDYRSAFRQGATLVPRLLSLVERKPMGRLGADPAAPMVVSRRSSLEKSPWRNAAGIENQVEAEFLRPVLLGESILPYRLVRLFEGVIPVSSDGKVLSAATALGHKRSHGHLAGWMGKAEELWNELSRSGKMTLIERWNFQRGLSNQFPVPSIRVVYAASGTLPAAILLRDARAIIEQSSTGPRLQVKKKPTS